jgi:hypothetical protein
MIAVLALFVSFARDWWTERRLIEDLSSDNWPQPRSNSLDSGGPRGEAVFLPFGGQEGAVKTLILLASLALPATDDLAARASAIKPAARELTWLGVPWVPNLAEAQKMAREEKRPIFLWVTGDDPLERC